MLVQGRDISPVLPTWADPACESLRHLFNNTHFLAAQFFCKLPITNLHVLLESHLLDLSVCVPKVVQTRFFEFSLLQNMKIWRPQPPCCCKVQLRANQKHCRRSDLPIGGVFLWNRNHKTKSISLLLSWFCPIKLLTKWVKIWRERDSSGVLLQDCRWWSGYKWFCWSRQGIDRK